MSLGIFFRTLDVLYGIYLRSDVRGLSGCEIVAGSGDGDAADWIGVAGQEGLLTVTADGPGNNTRAERVKGPEAIRRAKQSILYFT